MGGDTLPVVLWVRDLGPRESAAGRLHEVRLTYRSVSSSVFVEVPEGER